MDLIDPHNVSEIFFDGVHDVRIIDGVVRFAIFSRQNSAGVIVARLAVPVSELPDVIQALVIVLAEAARTNVKPSDS